MFKAMAQALLEPQPEEPVQSRVVVCEEEEPPPSKPQTHVSLPQADPAGFYTDSAFFARAPARVCHPFYRVKHKWKWLENMDQQAYRTSVERNIADIRGLLHVASNWGCELHTQDADTKGDDAIKEVARLDDALSVKIRDLKDVTCEDEDRTKVEASAVWSTERSARKLQKKYEERAISDEEAACGASW